MSSQLPQSDPAPTKPARNAAGVFGTMKEWIGEHLYRLSAFADAAREWRGDAIWLTGAEKHTGAPLSAFYFGSGRSFEHLLDKLYASYSVSRSEENHPMWRAARWLKSPRTPVDLVFADLPWPYYHLLAGSQFVHVPGWLVQKIPLPGTWQEVVGNFRKNTRSTDLRKIRKFGLTFRLTTEQAEVERFHDAMYLPYVEGRFGNLAIIDSRDEIVGVGTSGGLLQVLQQDRVVGAVVLFRSRKTLHFLWFGLPQGPDAALLDAALSGLYYFTIQHAYALGCDEVNLSYTAPLLNDGIYRYKRKWGAVAHNDWPFGEILVRPLNLRGPVESFLVNQPLVVVERDGLVGKVLLAHAGVSPNDVTDIIERYASQGIRCIKIFSTRPLGPDVQQHDYGEPASVQLFDLTNSTDPAADFCAR